MTEFQAPQPEPFWFGDPQNTCFGMLHRPRQSNGRGVVICNSVGFEGVVAFRPLRQLADRLVARGFTVLRFDYPGTGDSAGGEWEPNLVKSWRNSVGDAVDLLRQNDVADVQLLGFRMGATLAASFLGEQSAVSGVALWAPCVSGRTYAREVRALALLSAAHRPPQGVTADWFPADSLEAVGFEFTSSTLDEFKELDLSKITPVSPPPAALVLDRDDMPASQSLVDRLTESGAQVDHETFAGYQDFITEDEATSVVPESVLDRLAIWLESTTPRPQAAPVRPVPTSTTLVVHDAGAGHLFPPDTTSAPVIEEPAWIDDRLFAIVTRPQGEAGRLDEAVLLLNTGSINRSGPGRLHTTLARHLASRGLTVVRVDLGANGDSAGTDDSNVHKPYRPQRLDESLATIEWIRSQLGHHDVSLFGICSGAFNAYRAALRDPDLRRVVLVNQVIFSKDAGETLYASPDSAVLSANLLTKGLGDRTRWKNLLTGKESVPDAVRQLRRHLSGGALRGFNEMVRAKTRNRADRRGDGHHAPNPLMDDFEHVADGGTEVTIVFAVDEPGEQYLRLMGGARFETYLDHPSVTLLGIDGGDHVFSPPGSRQQLVEELTELFFPRQRTSSAGVTSSTENPQSSAPAELPDRRTI